MTPAMRTTLPGYEVSWSDSGTISTGCPTLLDPLTWVVLVAVVGLYLFRLVTWKPSAPR
jgi:hypothetical protein